MYFKKWFFNYPRAINGKLKIGDLELTGFNAYQTDGVLLISYIGKYANFYLPSIGISGTFENKVFCIFKNIEEYVYQEGLLFIKDGNSEEGDWLILEPNQFAWCLTETNLLDRIKSLPKIHYKGKSKISILPYNFSSGIMIEVDNMNYWIENKVSYLNLQQKLGTIEPTKLNRTIIFKHANNSGQQFFEDGKPSLYYSSIQEFKHPIEDNTAYLCFEDIGCTRIKALKVGGKTNLFSHHLSTLYTVEFDEPVEHIQFIGRDIKEGSYSGTDFWKITYRTKKEAILLQGFGEVPFSQILPIDKLINT